MPTFRRRLSPLMAGHRRGFTLPELLCAIAILTVLAGAMGTLAYGVGNANDYCRGQNEAAQHARVVLERIRRNVVNCKASESFPGCMVASSTVGAYSYPDRLLIWKSNGVTAGATEYPRLSDLIVYAYNPSRPIELLEITTTDTTLLASSSNSALNAVVDAMLSSNNSTKTIITDRLDIATTGGGSGVKVADLLADAASRGMVRFRIIMSPTDAQWTEYKGGFRTWPNIDWPLDQYGTNFGNRRVSCLTEIQMLADDKGEFPAVPFFGSATKVYPLAK
ncbi:MAG: prepilin-type N-terminal cleavage/methylation domain-containing protein [Planctomycetales bacterium]|nr:prepilin-type N-terminal cleavage/methylation domain-containing protein [Planctomycetales bacterium]